MVTARRIIEMLNTTLSARAAFGKEVLDRAEELGLIEPDGLRLTEVGSEVRGLTPEEFERVIRIDKKAGFKIIGVSNFDNEKVSDVLICESIADRSVANTICKHLNAEYSGENSTYYHRVVDQNHVLYKYEP